MAMSQAANYAEKAMGHTGDATTEQNLTNPGRDREKYADPSGETMKALVWMGKNDVRVGEPNVFDLYRTKTKRAIIVDAPKPKVIEDTDVILKVTGSTICGSDLHLLHGQFNDPSLHRPQLMSYRCRCGNAKG